MNRALVYALSVCGMMLSSGCSDRERSDPDAAEWTQIEALADDPVVDPAVSKTRPVAVASDGEFDAEFADLAVQLEQMATVRRESGQTLLTGERLSFDYQEHFVRMDGDVLVDDDRGQLRAESLIGRFSGSNRIEYVEAKGDVSVDAAGRQAHADAAVYDYLEGSVVMEGRASLSDGGSRLSGERIQFQLTGERRMICEPNATLVVAGRSEPGAGGVPEMMADTEIRANRIVYDEGIRRADLLGNVRLRNPQVAINCSEIHLFLQDGNNIDWIEALGDVIIESQGRKALAERAAYYAHEGKFILEGQPPMITMGRNMMTGDRITYWHETQVVLCEPNGRILYYHDLNDETRAKIPKDLDD